MRFATSITYIRLKPQVFQEARSMLSVELRLLSNFRKLPFVPI